MLKKNYKVASTEGRKKKKTTRKQQFAEFVVVVFVRPVRGSFCCFHGQCISMITHHIVKSMIALTISLSHFLRALTALPLLQLACSATWPVGLSEALNFSAAAIWACWERSSIFASPKTMYVSDPGDWYTSGRLMIKRMFFDFLMVTRLTPVTGFNPNLLMAFLAFFSDLDCLDLETGSSVMPAAAATAACWL